MKKNSKVKSHLMNEGQGDDRLPLEVIQDAYKKAKENNEIAEYVLLDSGEGRKLEKIGNYLVDRQCPVAFWEKSHPSLWNNCDAVHQRTETGGGFWDIENKIPDFWFTKVGRFHLKTKLTSFGHLGFFAEQIEQWNWFFEKVSALNNPEKPLKILNLFAYTGGSSLACALAGAQVTHVDAAKGVVDWARQNAAINSVPDKQIRYAVEDVKVFLDREHKRGNTYDGVILDPPSFGRGPNKEVFKIEDDILPLLKSLSPVLSKDLKLFHFSSHSQGFSPLVLKNLANEIFPIHQYNIEMGEMTMKQEHKGNQKLVPSGQFTRAFKN